MRQYRRIALTLTPILALLLMSATVIGPPGSQVYTNAYTISSSFDLHPIRLDGSQVFTAVVIPLNNQKLSLQLLRGNPPQIFSPKMTAVNPGESLILQAQPISEADTYHISVQTQVGSGEVNVSYFSSSVEAEPYTGVLNDDALSAQDLSTGFVRYQNQVAKADVLGSLSGADDVDFYKLDIAQGEPVQVALSSYDGAAPVVQVFDPSGTLLVEGAPSASGDMWTAAFSAAAAGAYSLKVSGTEAVSYNLLLLKRAVIEEEPNNNSASAQLILSGQAVFGMVGVPSIAEPASTFDIDQPPVRIGFNPLTGTFYSPFVDPSKGIGLRYNGVEFLPGPAPLTAFTFCYGAAPERQCPYIHQTSTTTTSTLQVSSFYRAIAGDRHYMVLEGSQGALFFRRIVTYRPRDSFLTVTTQVTNTGTTTLTRIRSLETINPNPAGINATNNDVLPDKRSVIASNAGGALVLGSGDSRAAASAEDGDLMDPDLVIDSPVDPNGTDNADTALQLAFNLGNLSAGSHTSFSFILALGSDLVEAKAAYQAGQPALLAYAPDDSFNIDLTAGQKLVLTSSIPYSQNDASYRNDLDPELFFYAPNGSLLAHNDDLSAANRNAQITYLVTADGRYSARLTTSSKAPAAKGGEYLLFLMIDNPPALDPIANKTVNQGSSLIFQVSANDPDQILGDSLRFSVTSGPTGAAVDPSSGMFDWRPSVYGDFDVTLRATNSYNLYSEQVFSIHVVQTVKKSTLFLPLAMH